MIRSALSRARGLAAAAVAAATLGAAASADAGVIYQSLPDLMGDVPPSSFAATGQFGYVGQAITLGSGATITSIDFVGRVGNVLQDSLTLTVNILQDAGGSAGAHVYTGEFYDAITSENYTPFGLDEYVAHLKLAAPLSLAAGDYLVFVSGGNVVLYPPAYGGGATGVFMRDVSSPTSGAAYEHIRYDLGIALHGEAVAAVPEPATWALMIGGFGLAGAALRRRRAVTA